MQQLLELEAFIQWESLPSLPSLLNKTIDQVGTVSSMDYDIVEMIKYDVSITCRVLKLANSPLYGYAGQISTLQQACGLLGLEMIKNIVFTTPAIELYQDSKIDSNISANYSGLWKSMAVSGVISEWLGSKCSELDLDICFVAGLIQGIGKIGLVKAKPALLFESHQYSERENIAFEEAEKKIIGFSHMDVGQKFAIAWGYPPSLIGIFQGLNENTDAEIKKLTCTVKLAKFISDKLGYIDGMGIETISLPSFVWSEVEFSESELDKSWSELKAIAKKVEDKFAD